jgi:hypothetical protein
LIDEHPYMNSESVSCYEHGFRHPTRRGKMQFSVFDISRKKTDGTLFVRAWYGLGKYFYPGRTLHERIKGRMATVEGKAVYRVVRLYDRQFWVVMPIRDDGDCLYTDLGHPDGDGCGCLHPESKTRVCPGQCICDHLEVQCPLGCY